MKRVARVQKWQFSSRFRRHAFGWRSQPAIQRIKQAVTEIKLAARRDPVLGAEGAVLLLEISSQIPSTLSLLVHGPRQAVAKVEGLYDEALALASASPCDPSTLTRATRELSPKQLDFAISGGLLALHWLVHGYDYEGTGADVWAAYSSTMAAAQERGNVPEVREWVRQVIAAEAPVGFVTRTLGIEFGV